MGWYKYNKFMSTWFKSFIDSLERLIEKPPYLIFVFIGAIFLVISLITKFGYEQSWIFLLYSIGGMIWRYAEKDLLHPINEKYPGSEVCVRSIYHIGNFGLFIALVHYLNIL